MYEELYSSWFDDQVSKLKLSHTELVEMARESGRRAVMTEFLSRLKGRMTMSEAAVSLSFAYYNFCKTHGAIRMTPAQAAGVESSAWTVAELVANCGE